MPKNIFALAEYSEYHQCCLSRQDHPVPYEAWDYDGWMKSERRAQWTLNKRDAAMSQQRDHADECMCERCIWHPQPTVKEIYGRSPAQVILPDVQEMLRRAVEDPQAYASAAACHVERRLGLPEDSKARKDMPMYSGVLAYFPLALAAIAKHSKESNDKHNPGEPLHWSREKSSDHMDCVVRHAADYSLGDQQALVALVWRGLAQLQLDEEARIAAGHNVGAPDGKR